MATAQVILKEKIENLGAEADIVTVKSGYARNFLVPSGKALEANKANMRQLEVLKAARAEREANELADAEKKATRIKKLRLNLELATGQGGKAFGSITTKDLAEAIKENTGLDIDRHAIKLEAPIKTTGKFDIPIKLHHDVTVDLRLSVDAEKPEPDAEAGDQAAE